MLTGAVVNFERKIKKFVKTAEGNPERVFRKLIEFFVCASQTRTLLLFPSLGLPLSLHVFYVEFFRFSSSKSKMMMAMMIRSISLKIGK